MSPFSVENFLSHSTETNMRNRSVLCFRKFLLAKKLIDKREGEVSKFPSKTLCLKVLKNFLEEPFNVSLISGYRKICCFRGICHHFLSKIFCLTVQKHFEEEPFCAVFQKISDSEKTRKNLWIRGMWKYQKFPSKIFCLTVPKIFVGGPFSAVFQNFSGRPKIFMDKGGKEYPVSRVSLEKTLSHSTEKFRRGAILCFRKFRVSKNLMPKTGISPFSTAILLSHSTEKFCRGSVLCFTKILVSIKIMDKRGGGSNKIFLRIFLVSDCRKSS